MADAQEIKDAAERRDKMLHEQRVDALQRELANSVRTGKDNVDEIVAQLDHYGGDVPAEVRAQTRTATTGRAGAEKRG